MIEYISTMSKRHFLLLNVRVNINLQSRSAVRYLNENKLIGCYQFEWLQKQKKYYYIKLEINTEWFQ